MKTSDQTDPRTQQLRQITATLLLVAIAGLAVLLYVEYDYFRLAHPLHTVWLFTGLLVFVGGLVSAYVTWLASRRVGHP